MDPDVAEGPAIKGKARLNRYEELVNQKQDQVAAELEIYIPPGLAWVTSSFKGQGISKTFGDNVLYEMSNSACRKAGLSA